MPGTQEDFDKALAQIGGGSDSTSVALPEVYVGGPQTFDTKRIGTKALVGLMAAQQGLSVATHNMFPSTGDISGQLRAATGALDALPTGAGMAADIASPGVGKAMLFSGLASGVGELAREGGYNALGQGHMFPGGPGSTLLRAAQAGVGGSLSTGLGRGVQAGVGYVAREMPGELAAHAMQTPSKQAAALGNVRDPFLAEGVPVGRKGTFSGRDEVAARLQGSLAEEDAITQAYHDRLHKDQPPNLRGGYEVGKAAPIKANMGVYPRVNLSDFADRAYHRIATKMGAGMKPAERQHLTDLANEAASMRNHEGGVPVSQESFMTPKEVLEFKRVYDNRAEQVYEKMKNEKISPMTDLEDRFNKALADEARRWLKDVVPGLEPVMARSQKLVNLRRAMSHAESVPERLSADPIKNLATRYNLSRAALAAQKAAPGLTSRGARLWQSQLPRMVGGQLTAPRAGGQ